MLTITSSLQSRIGTERARRGADGLYLRVLVDAGGCSGFEYQFSWVEPAAVTPDDTVYESAVVLDDVSAPYLKGATIDFVQSLMGEEFKITNPNAVSSCGCGNSFAV
jgi:iron-sulfur cluster insertion protein